MGTGWFKEYFIMSSVQAGNRARGHAQAKPGIFQQRRECSRIGGGCSSLSSWETVTRKLKYVRFGTSILFRWWFGD